MRAAVAIIAFGVRHFLAVLLAMIVGGIVWTIGYFGLLLFAAYFDEGLGSPFSYPAGLLLIGLSCSLIGWGIFAPAAAIGRTFCWLTQWPLLTAIPFVVVSAFGLTYLVFALGAIVFFETSASAMMTLKYFTLYLSIPLTIYWWLTEGPGALTEAMIRWLASHSEKTKAETTNIAIR